MLRHCETTNMMGTMLFASDLDQTLIYSAKSFGDQNMRSQVEPVELLDDRFISYMTKPALSKLKEITSKTFFVPVTTRTKLQYQRVNFQGHEIAHQYAVTSNGGTVFNEGIEDLDWTQQVLEGKDKCLASQDLIKMFDEIRHPSWVIGDSGKLADDLFYYCLIEREKVPHLELKDFKIKARENNWELSVQGRKLYLVPKNVNKKAAIQYIRQKESNNLVVAAGDSLLDLDMLNAADLAIAPSHGELHTLYIQGGSDIENIKFTKKNGIEAAEEILDYVSEFL